jgi:hypothetical protein
MPELSSCGASTYTARRTRGGETGGNFRKVYPAVPPTALDSPAQSFITNSNNSYGKENEK